MSKHNNKRTFRDMQDCLDSDDELPTTYTEKTELPAYLDDGRFDDIGDLIEFPWLNTLPIRNPQTQDQENCNAASIATDPHVHKEEITLKTEKGSFPKKSIFEEWNTTILSNHTASQTNKSKTNLLKIPLTTNGDARINKDFLDQTGHEICERKDKLSIFQSTTGKRTLLKRGILKEQDIICMKSFAAQTTDGSALLWFINFLQNKDLQSEYKFLKSCLVTCPIIDDNCGQMYSQAVSNSSNIKFEIIVI